MEIQRTKIGYLVGGGLKENFRVRLTVSPQEIQRRSSKPRVRRGAPLA